MIEIGRNLKGNWVFWVGSCYPNRILVSKEYNSREHVLRAIGQLGYLIDERTVNDGKNIAVQDESITVYAVKQPTRSVMDDSPKPPAEAFPIQLRGFHFMRREQGMSYDITIESADGESLHFPHPHNIAGGTYAMGGTTEAWLNVTYNYTAFFHQVWNGVGIQALNGKKVEDAIPELERGVEMLGTDNTDRYWDATAGNAGKALDSLLELCRKAKDTEHGHDVIVIT